MRRLSPLKGDLFSLDAEGDALHLQGGALREHAPDRGAVLGDLAGRRLAGAPIGLRRTTHVARGELAQRGAAHRDVVPRAEAAAVARLGPAVALHLDVRLQAARRQRPRRLQREELRPEGGRRAPG